MLIERNRYREIYCVSDEVGVSTARRLYNWFTRDSYYAIGKECINEALESLPKNPGGLVRLTEGEFQIDTTLDIKRDGTMLEGIGRSGFNLGVKKSGSQLKAKASLNNPVIKLNDADVHHFEIRHLSINGNKSGQTSGNGITIDWTGTTLTNSPRSVINSVSIHNTKDHGLYLDQPSGSGGGAMDVTDLIVSGCDGNGVDHQGADTKFLKCLVHNSGLAAYKVYGNAGNSNFVQCSAKLSGQITAASGYGWDCDSTSRVFFDGCDTQTNTRSGLYLRSGCDNYSWNGGQFESDGETGSKQPAILIECSRVTVTGVKILDNNAAGSRVMDDGVEINGSVDDILLHGSVYNYETSVLDDNTSPSGSNITNNLVDFGQK